MKTIIQAFDMEAGPDEAFEALAGDKIDQWWSTVVEADNVEGGLVRWTFEEGFNPVMRIQKLEPGAVLEWRCVDGHVPWKDNTFRFELKAMDGGTTRLRFRQEYAEELDEDDYGIYNFNWGYYLESLRLLVTTGEGRPLVAESP